jgi:ATP-binding protein involved in chromosome partitioning
MSDEAATAAVTPRQIRQNGPRCLTVVWADGHESRYDVRDLRLACACAHCINEWTGERLLDPSTVPVDVHPLEIEGVGRYAIQIEWSDGHSWGIYTFQRLRAMG